MNRGMSRAAKILQLSRADSQRLNQLDQPTYETKATTQRERELFFINYVNLDDFLNNEPTVEQVTSPRDEFSHEPEDVQCYKITSSVEKEKPRTRYSDNKAKRRILQDDNFNENICENFNIVPSKSIISTANLTNVQNSVTSDRNSYCDSSSQYKDTTDLNMSSESEWHRKLVNTSERKIKLKKRKRIKNNNIYMESEVMKLRSDHLRKNKINDKGKENKEIEGLIGHDVNYPTLSEMVESTTDEAFETNRNNKLQGKSTKVSISITDSDDIEDPFSSGSDDNYVPSSESDSTTDLSVSGESTGSQVVNKIFKKMNNIKERITLQTINNVDVESKEENVDTSYKSRNEYLTISVTRKKSGKRLRDKRHSCYICNKILTNNMARHFELVHGNDFEVAKILAMPKKSKSRRDLFENLMKAGDFYHNCNVLTLKEGELILVRRPDANTSYDYEDFAPCIYCLGFMLKRYLWHHMKKCKSKGDSCDEDVSRRGPLIESSALMFEILGPKVNEDYRNDIILSFRLDNISNICKEDTLILKVGAFFYEKYGKAQQELIRQSMRQLSRLKMELEKIYNINRCLAEWITPKYFDNVVNATKSLCTHSNVEKANEFNTPSVALKIGHLLRKCIAIESGAALRKGGITRHNELKAFSELMDLEWSVRISSKALATLSTKKMNNTELLPLTSDLIKLSTFLQNEMKRLKPLLHQKCSRKLWSDLATVTLCRIILFNKRRSGEASRMTLNNYSMRPAWSEQGNEEFKSSLSPLETELANRLIVVEIMGKRGRKVPVILTDEMKSCVDTLIATRQKSEISETNPFIFARSQISQSYLRGHDCLRKCCVEAAVVCSTNITSTKLRKYIATVCQIFDLKENECDWLARHLGHDIRVHRDFYRMHENAVELTKVSRLLIAVDRGEAQKYSGKQLQDINIEDLPPIELEDENANEDDVEEEPQIDDIVSEASEFFNIQRKEKPNGAQRICVKKTWSSEEMTCVLKHFAPLIKRGTLPGKAKCEEFLEKYSAIFQNRKWSDVKFCVKNNITKINKQKQNHNRM